MLQRFCPGTMKSLFILVALSIATPSPATAQLATKKTLTLELVKAMAASAEEFAVKNGWKVAVAVLEDLNAVGLRSLVITRRCVGV